MSLHHDLALVLRSRKTLEVCNCCLLSCSFPVLWVRRFSIVHSVPLIIFSYDQGVFGGILQLQDYRDQFNHPNDTETGIIVSSYCLGALFGCILNVFIGDYFGRRRMVRK